MANSTSPMRVRPAGRRRAAQALLCVLVASTMMAGCVRRDHMHVGSVPDDYRTNHPIVVGDREQVVDIPVGQSDFRVTTTQRVLLEGFLSGYDHSSSAPVLITAPIGSANQGAATSVAAGLAEVAVRNGVGRGNIILQNYQVSDTAVSAPIRVSYTAVRASTGPCGLWPGDVLDTTENKHYANFGCAYQNNLAAQVADPADLLGPRKMTEIDPENRDSAIREYKERGVADSFSFRSEVNY